MSKFKQTLNEAYKKLLSPTGFEPIVPMLRRDALGQDINIDKDIDPNEMGEDYLPYTPESQFNPEIDVQISEPYSRTNDDTEFKIDLMYRNGLIQKYFFHNQPEHRAENLKRVINNYDKKKSIPPKKFDGRQFTSFKTFHDYLIKYIKFHSYKHT